MEISVAQLDVHYKDKAANLQRLHEQLAGAKSVGNLVLVPELFTTGYVFDAAAEIHALAEDAGEGPTVAALQSLAAEFHTTIVAGIAERHGSAFYNSAVVVDFAGMQHRYRKLTLPRIDAEYFSRGERLVVFDLAGVRFGIVICFDIWFPEIVRAYARLGVQVLLHPANFGGPQSTAIARARAIENGMHVVTSNRLGSENAMNISATYRGRSQVIDPSGAILLDAGQHPGLHSVTVAIDPMEERRVLGVHLQREIDALATCLPGSTA